MSYETITVSYDRETGVATISLDRPEKRNAISGQMAAEFIDAVATLKDDVEVRVIVTRANGPSFSSGLDLHELKARYQDHTSGEMAKLQSGNDWGEPLTGQTSDPTGMFEAATMWPKIMVAQVHGYCLGGRRGRVLGVTEGWHENGVPAQ